MDNSEQFTPETVDEEIERILIAREGTTPSQQTLQALHGQLSARHNEPALDRVWTRLAQHRMAQQPSLADRSFIDRKVAMARHRKEHQMSTSSHKTSRVASGFTFFATAVFLVLLLGSLAFVFQLARQQHSIAHTSGTTIGALPKGTLYTLIGNTAYALDEVTHKPLWEYQFPIKPSQGMLRLSHNPIEVINGVYYVWWSDNNIYALNASDGSLLWKYNGDIREGKLFVDANGVYFMDATLTYHFTLKALDPMKGTLKWQKPFNTGITALQSISDGRLYVSGQALGKSVNTYALNTKNGSQIWMQSQANRFDETSGYVADGVYYASIPDSDVFPGVASVYAYDAATGQPKWHKHYNTDVEVSNVNNGILYVSTSTDNNTRTSDGIHVPDTIEALSTQNGTLLWKYTASSPNGVSDSTVVDGTAYVTLVNEKENNGSVVALNATTGKVRWTHSLAEKPTYIAPTVVQDTVAVGTAGGKVTLLRLSDGSFTSTINSVPTQQDTTNVTVGQ